MSAETIVRLDDAPGEFRLKSLYWLLPLALLAYLLLWPAPIDPQPWTPPPAPSLEEGPYARNERLRGVQRIADGAVQGPEAIAFGPDGRLYTGLADGRVVSMRNDGADCRVLGHTGGRPLGLAVREDGSLIVADAIAGLLRMEPGGRVQTLSRQIDGFALGFVDDLALDARGRVYFSDASWKFGYGQHVLDALEHGARGRLALFDTAQNAGGTLLAHLNFANGVALGPDEAYVLVNESAAYRITRYWLKGERAGRSEVFAENLPGFPDNITFNGRDRFWVALYAPRDAMLDALLPYPFARSMLARLPGLLHPKPPLHAFILGFDLDGRLREQYQYDGDDAYAPITSVREHDGALYLGSLSANAIGRIELAALRGSSTGFEAPAPIKTECRAD